jgi:hypothetical protein
MAKKKAKKKAVKKVALPIPAQAIADFSQKKAGVLKAMRKFKEDQVVYFDQLRKSRLQ